VATSRTSWRLVLEGVLDLDLARNGHAVVRDRGSTELLVEHHVAALGAERDLDRVGERVDAAQERATRLLVELQLLVSHSNLLDCCGKKGFVRAPASGRGHLLELREDVGLAQDQVLLAGDLISVPPYLE